MFVFFAVPSNAQDTLIRGMVLQAEPNQPAPNAELWFRGENYYRFARTDSNGVFFIPHIDPGTYVVRTSQNTIGMCHESRDTLTVTANEITHVRIYLDEKVLVFNPVIISEKKRPVRATITDDKRERYDYGFCGGLPEFDVTKK